MDAALKTHFGYNEFRPNQKEIITAVLEGKDVIAILPTGAGKSVCYQLPALLKPGITVVVSPLISLMQDQVVSLSKTGLPAALLNSSLHPEEMRHVMGHLTDYKLLYIAPERLANPEFIQALQQTVVSLFAIDEAHCISQWGHSFRPEYRQLSLLKKTFPNTSIMALTATATLEVQKDISVQLSMQDPFVIRASFDRPNLTFRVSPKAASSSLLLQFLAEHKGEPGIIYSATRNSVEETHELLLSHGFLVGKYHAGLSDAERAKTQHDFIYGECPLIVATVAFGMGIHKPDIRFVVHLDMPRSIEQYYQEVGRAGRDGLASQCLMFHSVKELKIYDLFLEKVTDKTVRKMMKEKTDQMLAFCRSSACRRKSLLAYFGEQYPEADCGGCDRCGLDDDLVDCTIIAQKILSCVYRVEGKFGIQHVIDILRGQKTKKVMEKGHDRLSTFNLSAEFSEDELRYFIANLIEKGFLQRAGEEYPILSWTPLSRGLVKGETSFKISPITKAKSSGPKKAPSGYYDRHLFDTLSAIRRLMSKQEAVPAFVIFADKTLQEMCRYYPSTEEDLLQINGVSLKKWEKHGAPFLEAIQKYCKERKIFPSPTPKKGKRG
jgi:ATP-dependent DNA helicase RecQ